MAGDAALWQGVGRAIGVRPAGGTGDAAVFDEAVYGGLIDRGAGVFSVFQGPLFLGAFDLAEVVDAGICLGGAARFNEVRDGNGEHQRNHNEGERDADVASDEAGESEAAAGEHAGGLFYPR